MASTRDRSAECSPFDAIAKQFPFRLFSAPFIFCSLVQPPVQCVKIDLKDKDAVK